VLAAIEEAKRRFPGERIEVVYAGTGPYAALAVPLMPRLSQVSFTLIDIHDAAIESLRAVIGHFGFESLVRAVVAGDATAYEHPSDLPLHVVICETMQRALTVEPQVAIVRHLASRLHPRGIVVPQRVSVDLVLRDGADERVGRAVELTLETARDPHYWSQRRVLRLPGVRPKALPVLVTTINTFDGHELREYDSGLTHPEVLWDLTDLTEGEELELWYELGSHPRIRARRPAPSPAAP